MFLFRQILPAAAISAVASLIGAFAIAWIRNHTRLRPEAVATAVGYACGHLFITGWVSLPPTDSTNWLPIFGLAAAGLGSTLPLLRHNPARMILAGFIAAGALRLLLQPQFRFAWPDGVGWVWVIGLSITVVLQMWRVDALIRLSTTWIEAPLLLFISCAGTSVALSLSGSLLLGQFAAVLGAALAGMLVLGWRDPANRESSGMVFSLLLVATITSGCFFAELPVTSAILLGSAPVLASIPIAVSGSPRILGLRLALISAPVALALFLAFRASPSLDY